MTASSPFLIGSYPTVVLAMERTDGLGETIKGGAIPILGSRPFGPIKGVVPNSANSYVADKGVGGVIAVDTGLPPGTPVRGTMRWRALKADCAGGGFAAFLFDAVPTGNYADNTIIVPTQGDMIKNLGSLNGSLAAVTTTVVTASLSFSGVPVDASGRIYFAGVMTAPVAFATANSLFWEMDGFW